MATGTEKTIKTSDTREPGIPNGMNRPQEYSGSAIEQWSAGDKFSQEEINAAVKLKVWTTNFSHEGGDFVIYRLYDENGGIIREVRVVGY